MSLRTAALAAATGALLTTGAAAAPSYAHPSGTGDGVAVVKNDTLTPWSVVDFLLVDEDEDAGGGASAGHEG
ncbi:hypothetical protein [Streptomyces sp. TRM64462]|uniref:hypothetical protein n=1 Tax=Streptomyces sp. TRM64462 TaxID=2741726 RepID=UPI001586747A|nr:hypothetical protein [Streptomyces sp. TRM64462]